MFWFWCIFVRFLVHFLRFLAFLKSAENAPKSKVGHESTLYCSDFDDFGVVWKLTVSAFKRRQARQNPSILRSIRGHVLIRKSWKNMPHIGPHFLPWTIATVSFDIKSTLQRHELTKTSPWIDHRMLRSRRYWCRWKAESMSFPRTPISFRTEHSMLNSLPCFDDVIIQRYSHSTVLPDAWNITTNDHRIKTCVWMDLILLRSRSD